MTLDHALLLGHAVATLAMAGVIWTVQLVVYPGFAEAGRTAAWQAVHEAHTRRTARLVALPWAVQGATLAALLVRRPEGAPVALLAVTALLAAVPVFVTVVVSVPLHGRLARGWDADAWQRLVRTNWLRTAAWTAGAGCAAALLVA